MRFFIFLLALSISFPAFACRPSMDYLNRPIAERLVGPDFFIGKVKSVSAEEVVFTVMVPGGAAKDAQTGEDATFKRGDYGTCGRVEFAVGQLWLYNGSDISFTDSRLLEPADLKDGLDLKVVRRNLVARLDPAYVPPRIPLKEDLPVPGVYSGLRQCKASDPGFDKARYTLTIGEPDPATKKYPVDIVSGNCTGESSCRFRGKTAAYGYGQLAVPLGGESPEKCLLLIQQLSSPQAWPRLKAGEAQVILNDGSCAKFIADCEGAPSMASPVLQKQ